MAMRNIIVCIHQVFDPLASLQLSANEKAVCPQADEEHLLTIEPSDLAALEIALQLQKTHQTTLTVICAASAAAKDDLRYCVARGATNAIHLLVSEEDRLDTWNTSLLIAEQLKQISFSLILCGEIWQDIMDRSFGPFLAEHLGLPQITRAEHVEIHNDTIQARSVCDHGDRELITCPCPALITIARFAQQPQYVAMKKRLHVTDASIKTIPVDEKAIPSALTQISMIGYPRPRVKYQPPPEKNLSASERLKSLIQGGQTKKQSDLTIHEGDTAVLAQKVIAFLEETGIISKQ
ncbi:MAG: hypothetical protein HPY45_02480 [Anaerolineae bacterium]|nr:hypothetical protein [Anaerolineae bacterium]